MITRSLSDILLSYANDAKFSSEKKAEAMDQIASLYQTFCKDKSQKEKAELNVKSRNADGNTPLIQCAVNGFTELAELLMEEKDVNINAENHDGRTALRMACNYKHNAIALRLIEKNAEIDNKDKDGVTPLMQASFNGNIALAAKLIENKADLNFKNIWHGNALFYAVEQNQAPMVKLLIDAKANLEEKVEKDPETILISATKKGHKDICKILIEAKANLNAQNKNKDTALTHAIAGGKVDIADLLIEAKADINLPNKVMATPVSLASTRGHTAIVTQLIEHKASLNIAQSNGFTALMLAVNRQHSEIITRLIQAGADLNLKDQAGETAFDEAVAHRNLELITLFLEKDCVITKPEKLREFLIWQTDPAKASQVAFCFGVLNHQTNNLVKAKKYYQEAIKGHHPLAYRRLGNIHELEADFTGASSSYIEGIKHNDSLSIKSLVGVAQKLCAISTKSEPKPNDSLLTQLAHKLYATFFKPTDKNADAFFHFGIATANIYYFLLSTGLHAELTSEQWLFLAADALSNPYFDTLHPLQNIRFSLRAAEKAKEQPTLAYNMAAKQLAKEEKALAENNEKEADTKEQIEEKVKAQKQIENEIAELTKKMQQAKIEIKDADAIISLSWKRFHTNLNSKNERDPLLELEKIASHEMMSIIANYTGEEPTTTFTSQLYSSEHFNQYIARLRKEKETPKNLVVELPKTDLVSSSERKSALSSDELDSKHVLTNTLVVPLSGQSLFAKPSFESKLSRAFATFGTLSLAAGAVAIGLSGPCLFLFALGIVLAAVGAISLGVAYCLYEKPKDTFTTLSARMS